MVKMNKSTLNKLRNISQDLHYIGDNNLCGKIKIIIANENNLDNIASDLTYSSIMRDLRHNKKDMIEPFMLSFKKSFDESVLQELDDPDKIALLEAIREISYESS